MGQPGVMEELRRLAAEIGWWASSASEEAEAFRETFDAVVEYPLAARLMGREVEVAGVVVWGGHHLRAEVWGLQGEGQSWVSLDGLEFEPETLAARVVWALRLRVGWPEGAAGRLPHFEGGPVPPPLGLGFAEVGIWRRIDALERGWDDDPLGLGEEAFAGVEAVLRAGLIEVGERCCGRLGDALLSPRLLEQVEDLEALGVLWTQVALRWLGLQSGGAEAAKRLGEWASLGRGLGVDVWAMALERADRALLEALDDYATAALECPGSLVARERWRRLAWESRLRRGALERLGELATPGALSVGDALRWARRLRDAGRRAEALALVDRELLRHEALRTAWSAPLASLTELRRMLQGELARQSGEVDAAWGAFEAAPSLGRLRAVLEACGEGERGWWFQRGAALLPAAGSRLEAALALGALDAAAQQVAAMRVIELAALEDRLLGQIGRGLGPGVARVKVELALAWRVLERGGRDHIERAAEAVARAEAAVDDGASRSLWEAVVDQLVSAHSRKRGFRQAIEVLRGRR